MLIIKEALEKKGITAKELGERMGVSPSTISKIMNGNPKADTLDRVAKAIGVRVGDLFDDRDEEVNGYVEVNGKIQKVQSMDDLRNICSNDDVGSSEACSL